MRYVSSQTERPIRIVGLSTALANGSSTERFYVFAFRLCCSPFFHRGFVLIQCMACASTTNDALLLFFLISRCPPSSAPLSSSLLSSTAHDLADWLGIEPLCSGMFNFRPSVRPVPLEVHIQGMY